MLAFAEMTVLLAESCQGNRPTYTVHGRGGEEGWVKKEVIINCFAFYMSKYITEEELRLLVLEMFLGDYNSGSASLRYGK